MIAEQATLLSIFLLGLFSAPHCAGMCGGIVAALGARASSRSFHDALQSSVIYNLGRVSMYVLLGCGFGALGMTFQHLVPLIGTSLRIIAGVLLVCMGLYIAGWWMGLRTFEHLVYGLFKPILGVQSMRWSMPEPIKLFMTGVLWGCLPCGLVYTMLTFAMTTGSIQGGGMIMLAFGLGTIPILLLTGAFADRMMLVIRQQFVRSLAGVLIILFGLWTLGGVVGTGTAHQHQHSSLMFELLTNNV